MKKNQKILNQKILKVTVVIVVLITCIFGMLKNMQFDEKAKAAKLEKTQEKLVREENVQKIKIHAYEKEARIKQIDEKANEEFKRILKESFSFVQENRQEKENTKSKKTKVIKLKFEVKYLTYKDYKGNNGEFRQKLKGTDRWNKNIYKMSAKMNVDPIIVKVFMAIESAGKLNCVNHNANGTTDYGPMQVNSSWGSRFNYSKMLTDIDYGIKSGIVVMKDKAANASRIGKKASIFNVAWLYNGYCLQGKQYAEKFSVEYENLSGKSAKSTNFYC